MPYLAKDIYSNCNPNKRYGYQGQEVDIVSDHAGIFIVRPKDGGLGFHVLRDELVGLPGGEKAPVVPAADPPPAEEKAPPPPRRSGRGKSGAGPAPSAPTGQGSLF